MAFFSTIDPNFRSSGLFGCLAFGAVLQWETMAHASPSIPSSATEVDLPGDFQYTRTRSDCEAHARVTDIVKEVGLGIDQSLRRPEAVSIEEEMEIGRQAIQEIPDIYGGRLDQSGPTARYIAEVGASLVAHVKRTEIAYTFYMLEDTEYENALALPGGQVLITRPFYDNFFENEAQLATVLGHEIAHVDEKHPLAAIQYARSLGMQGDLAITQAVFWLARSPYSSALEEEADRLGASYMHATGYSIFQSVRMWETQVSRFASSDSTEGDGGLLGGLLEVAVGEIDNLISSHPNAGRRACQLEQVAHDRFEEEPLERVYVGQTNLQRQEPMADKTY